MFKQSDILDLRAAVRHMAPAFEPRDVAPTTFPALCQAGDHCAILPVWAGASDQTIWGDVATNHAFRAWHDVAHLAGHYPFTLTGEIATCVAQLAALRYRYPFAPQVWFDIIVLEVIGQAAYHKDTGKFPDNQLQFVLAGLAEKTAL